jgi:hypothetical protein
MAIILPKPNKHLIEKKTSVPSFGTHIPIKKRLALLQQMPHNYMAKLLIDVGRWHLYSVETLEHREALEVLGDAYLIQMRKHYAKRYPDGVDAYELTEAGLEKLEELAGMKFADEACENREHYRTCCTKDTWRKYAPKDENELKSISVQDLNGAK